MTRSNFALLALCALVTGPLCGPVRADVLPPGSASVDHTIEILELEDAPAGTTFFLYPHHLTNPPKVVAPGEPLEFYKHNSPRLYATAGEVPTDAPEAAEWDQAFLGAPGIAASEQSFHRISSVPQLRRTRSVHTTWRFLGIEGDVIELEFVSEVHRDAFGGEVSPNSMARWPFLIALSGVGLVGLLGVVVVRRKRARESSA